jgi:FkbM family methyltransferase
VAVIGCGKYDVELIDDGDMVVAALNRDGEFEPAVLEAWADACRSGGKVCDIGAYTGLYAIAAARHGCQVAAFEPNPYVYRRLLANIKANRCRVKTFGHALSDRGALVQFYMKKSVRLTSAGTLEARGTRDHETSVMCYPLDDVIPDREIRAMKIDVEGHEEAVLRGAAETIRANDPIILIELLSDDASRRVDALLKDMGFRGDRLDSRNFIYRKTRTEV